MKKVIRNVRAKLSRTFVTDCPKCYKHFYGFNQWEQHIRLDNISYRYVCHRCAEEAKKQPEKIAS